MDTVVLATRNAGKIKELRALLKGHGLNVVGLDDFPQVGEIEETGTTFLDNARLKARAVAEALGLPAMADDSGLEVDALDGAPGVYSARYSPQGTDEANWRKLLRELDGVPEARRTARFRCVMVAHAPSGAEVTAEGAWEGRIALAPEGDGGFGYDPVFFDPELGRSAATLSREDKNARSHRGKALQALLARWPEFWDKV